MGVGVPLSVGAGFFWKNGGLPSARNLVYSGRSGLSISVFPRITGSEGEGPAAFSSSRQGSHSPL